jgi:hypothetical protein
MSKSTLISQLPVQNKGNPDDLMLDDDATVQEVFNQIAQSQNQEQPLQQVQNSGIPQMTPQQMYNGTPHVMPQEFIIPPQQNYVPNNVATKSKFEMFSKDLRKVFEVIAIVVIVQVVPIEQFVYKYVAIQHVPYSGIIIKSLLAGILYFLASEYL